MDESFHVTEKRELAAKPNFSVDSIWSYPKKFEDYYNDNFGFRIPLVAYNNYIKAFHFGVYSNPDLTYGKEGWMFLTPYQSKDKHQGRDYFSESEIIKIKETLVNRKKHLEDQGIQYLIVVVPDKLTLYPEFLPDDFYLADSSQLDQFMNFMDGEGVDIIDLRSELKKQKKEHKLYFKTDSHWNQHAGFIAYQEIMKVVSEWFPNIQTLQKENFDIELRDEIGGDLADLVGIKDFIDDVSPRYHYNETVPVPERLEIPEYHFFKNDWRPTIVYEMPDATLPRMVMFNDSFVSYIHHFFAPSFERTTFFWMYDFRTDLIEKEHPDIVIQMLVERRLPNVVK